MNSPLRPPSDDPLYALPDPARPHYATGMLLDAGDFADEQLVHLVEENDDAPFRLERFLLQLRHALGQRAAHSGARDQLTDAILYVSALELRCAKQLEDDSNLPLPPFLHGKMGERSRPSDRH